MLRDLAMKKHSDIHLLMVEHLVSRKERMDNEKMMHQCCYWETFIWLKCCLLRMLVTRKTIFILPSL